MELRDALLVRFHLSSSSLGSGEADVMFLGPDAKRRVFSQCGATAESGWLSAWLCFRRHGGGSCMLSLSVCVCVSVCLCMRVCVSEAESVMRVCSVRPCLSFVCYCLKCL